MKERERERERERETEQKIGEKEREGAFQKPRILVLLLNLVKQVVTIFGFHE